MEYEYGDVAFTEQVRAAQSQYGRSAALARLGMGSGFPAATIEPRQPLSDLERTFIATRDSFYLATTSSVGWPYLQFRGGAAGFVRVLDEHKLAWADVRGNCQYISTGNITGNDRVALFFMDYPRQARLKIFGRAAVTDVRGDPARIAAVAVEGDRGIIERTVTVTVAAYDWNCPQHITPRYSLDELDQLRSARLTRRDPNREN